MADTSGTYTLTGVTGTPITREAGANTTITYTITGSADTFNITGDAGSAVTIIQTATVADVLNLTANGGTITLNQTQTADTISATVQNGGKIVTGGNFSGTSTSSSLNFGTGGGSIILGTSGTYSAGTLSQLVNGFKNSSDVLDDQRLNFTGITGYTIAAGTTTGTQTITINDSSGNFVFTTNGTSLTTGSYTSLTTGPLKLTADITGGTNVAACFLTGVGISTPNGEVAVEFLAVGDLVSVVEDGKVVSHPVRWIGSRTVALGTAAPIDAYPVRIRAGAFAKNVPHRDLLVTSEHCIHVDDVLVPVRMLVNDASVLVDTNITRFTYFHIELERHAILIADGLQTESYLDTGNRSNFQNAAVTNLQADLVIDPTHKSWADAAAPLAVDRDTVEPIWRRLAARSVKLGMIRSPSQVSIGNEPDLRLVTETGLEVSPTLCDGRFYAFVIPASTRALRLVSRTSRPSETIGPFVDDRRELGVLIGQIGFSDGSRRSPLDAHLADAVLPGWHAKEQDVACRWTNGDALLPAPLSSAESQEVFLDIEVLAAGPYQSVALAA